jgi:hypothetical protein
MNFNKNATLVVLFRIFKDPRFTMLGFVAVVGIDCKL